MNAKTYRFLPWLLCFAILISFFPGITARADDEETEMPPDDSVLLHTVDLEPPEELQIVPVTNDMEDIRDPEEEVSPDESLQETTDTDT